ncbi:MAG: amidohydrolase [Gammaproteobacteria bacterium]|nr:amidohydrolase [Gammaproteobacteria bacterium]
MRLTSLPLFAVLLAGCASTPGADSSAAIPVDLIVYGDHVLTMAEVGLIPDGAVAIDDGRIVAVDRATTINRKYRAARTIAGDNKVVLPGLVNGHTHAAMSLLRGIADDLALIDWLENYIFPAEVALVDADFVRVGTELACWEMIRGGTTAFVDMYYFPESVARAVEQCGLRAVIAPTVIDQRSPDASDGVQSLEVARQFAEQWQGRNPRITPCVGAHAIYSLPQQALERVRDVAAEYGTPVCIHLSESNYEVQFARDNYQSSSTELLEKIGLFDNHVIGAHVVWPSDTDIATLARQQAGVIHNPTSNMKIASGVAPIPAMLAAGVPVGLGTDGAASNNDLDMWEEIRLAAFLHKVSQMDPTVLPAMTVLEMATWRGADAIGLGGEIGRLKAGMAADLIQVDLDDLTLFPVYDIASHLAYVTDEHDVTTVIVEGRVLMQDREVLTIDESRLRREAAGFAGRIRDRLFPQ